MKIFHKSYAKLAYYKLSFIDKNTGKYYPYKHFSILKKRVSVNIWSLSMIKKTNDGRYYYSSDCT